MIIQIRSMHRYAFRSGEWATLIGAEMSKDLLPVRACFVAMFPDGVKDSWAISDPDAEYEFRLSAKRENLIANGGES